MSREVKKYLPHNITPEQFMRPPTETFAPALVELCGVMESAINTRLTDLAKTRKRGKINPTPGLRIGSELELHLFSDTSVPHLDKHKPDHDNPNYSEKHSSRVKQVATEIILPPKEGGLGDILEPVVDVSRVFMEIRIKPMTVPQHFDAMQRIQEWVISYGTKLGFHPVVASQHFHFSLLSDNGSINLLEDKGAKYAVKKGVVDIYHRALPLLRLPEDLDNNNEIHYIGMNEGVTEKGQFGSIDDPYRMEGRLNNSEYAFDPSLNLFINLLGMYRGLTVQDLLTLDEDYQLSYSTPWKENGPNFVIWKDDIKYDDVLERMLHDKVLEGSLSEGVIRSMFEIFSQYWDISTGVKTVSEVREMAYKLVNTTSLR